MDEVGADEGALCTDSFDTSDRVSPAMILNVSVQIKHVLWQSVSFERFQGK